MRPRIEKRVPTPTGSEPGTQLRTDGSTRGTTSGEVSASNTRDGGAVTTVVRRTVRVRLTTRAWQWS